ncbi:PX domain-containing protein [Aspergillus sclerotialis]|uniref:PX domain-containing protein n=1 Tax=Aspergillus sclerotialis TaxID=2070753 RepID=A0A3A2Z3G2_9EURO|nr:PX domain-containing protein [Aspergillus sclerotialis]
MNELSAAFQVSGEAKSPKQAITQYLQQYPDSSLANILEDHQQRTKLNMVADDILSGFLSPNAYDCTPVRNFLREVLAGVIFESTISNLSRPEFINTWIIHIFSEGESEIMNAIDAGVEGARNQGVTTSKSSVDVRNSSLGSVDNPGPSSQIPSKPDQQLNNIDKATFDALKETTRLSNVIAVQDAQAHNTQQGANTSSVAGTCSRESCNAAFVPSTPNVAQGPSNRQTEDFKADSNDQPQDTYELYAKEPVLSTHSSQTPSQAPVNSPISAGKSDGTSLTLYGAYVSVDDGSQSSDQGAIRSKPTSDYLLQIEPVPSRCTGWMVFRKYADFESLHETLETISRLNKIKSFTDKHPILPPWKGQAKQPLARNLERYLQDALQHEALAESNRMKRFLEKDTRLGHQSVNSSTKSGSLLPSQASFENMGKGFLDALTSAPKGFAGGSKNVISGVTGALGNVAASSRRTPSSFPVENNQDLKDPFNFTPDQVECSRSPRPLPKLDTNTQEDSSSSPFGETRASPAIETHCDDSSLASGVGVLNDTYCNPSLYDSRKSSLSVGKQSTADVQPYESDIDSQKFSGPCDDPINKKCNESAGLPSPDCGPAETPSYPSQTGADAVRRSNHSITNEETQIAIELIFAVINELYSMSSAWNIRKTLLNAAKSYILRPGSPNLEMIRASLQDSIIDPQTSDEALAQYLTNLRENAFPTEDELKAWPPSPSETEKEHLRDAARKVFVQRGIPQTLMSVMGAAASREALGKIFDCLQVETVARGLAFSLLMQALRAVIL